MALASDSLFDKFGLFGAQDEQVQTCHHSGVQDEAVGAIADAGLADFENLDFADLLEIKDEPLIGNADQDVPGFDTISADQVRKQKTHNLLFGIFINLSKPK